MAVNISNFTGYEDSCEVIFTNSKGEYIKTFFLENLELDLFINQQKNHAVKITGYKCVQYDDLKSGMPNTLSNHELVLIETQMINLIDWELWEQENELDVDDFMYND